MSFTSAIFENGIEIGSARNAVGRLGAGEMLTDKCAQILAQYNVRPVLLTQNIPAIGDSKCRRKLHTVFDINLHNEPLNTCVGSMRLPQRLPVDKYVPLLLTSMNVQYVSGALVYHCQELALWYSKICDCAVGIGQISPWKNETLFLQGQSEAYYEFDALITAARRTYDALRYVMWSVFGQRGHTPSNFRKTLDSCKGLPDKLGARLSESWDTHGVKLTDYRDCIQHYAPVSYGIETAQLTQVAGGTWSVLLRIPDNPETKSRRAFKFATGLDALTYGWEITSELIGLSTEVFAAIPATG